MVAPMSTAGASRRHAGSRKEAAEPATRLALELERSEPLVEYLSSAALLAGHLTMKAARLSEP